MKLDFKNVFNSVHRDVMMSSILDIRPSLFSFLDQCYRNHSYLMYGDKVILSESGVQQGDPLGPLAFCSAIQKNLAEQLKCPLNL